MDLWSRARDSFVSRLEEQAKSLGLLTGRQGVGHVSGDWMAVKCPLCTDTGGSASLSIKTAHLMCRQCGADDPLFDWLQKRGSHLSAWDACKALAQDLGIEMPKAGKRAVTITASSIDSLVSALWEGDLAKVLRDALAARGFGASELAKYHLGFDGRGVVFPHVEPDGEVHPRAHRWQGPRANPKWMWTKAASSGEETNYYWPCHLPPEGPEVWICEGEWDCLVLREKLRVEAFTWTGGVTSTPNTGQIPGWVNGRRVVMVCDNDTWQGQGKEWAPDNKKMQELRVRKQRFLQHAQTMARFAESVEIATVPIPPEKNWGGDIRDWHTAGSSDLGELERCSIDEAVQVKVSYKQCSVREAASLPEHFVEFEAGVAGLDLRHDLWRPDYTACECSLGDLRCCQSCRLPQLTSQGIIHWTQDTQLRDLLACAMASNDPTKFIERHVIGRPRACPSLTMRHSKEGEPVSVWLAEDRDVAVGTELKVVSKQLPPANEELKVRGRVLLDVEGLSTFVIANDVRVHRTEKVDLKPHLQELQSMAPYRSDDPEVIQQFLIRRWTDLASNVTKIPNNEMIRIFDLTAHSCRRFIRSGKLMRGWLDTALIGVTRCGKTETVTCLFDHFGKAGHRASTQGNFTLAGLVAGNAKARDGNYRVVPGVFPRNHKRMVILDEAHLMATDTKSVNLIANLQEIRDRGIAESMKIAGQHKLPAEVRLMFIGNPPRGLFEVYNFKCEAFAEMFSNTPEFISRMDFGWIVTQEDAVESQAREIDDVPHEWNKTLCNVLRQRAWDLEPEDVTFDEGVWAVVESKMKIWTEHLDQDLPLFNGPDKANSLLRVAVAIANICFSHPVGNPSGCLVRAAHVAVAAAFMEESWERCDYFNYSERRRVGIGSSCFIAEYALIRSMAAPNEAARVLAMFLGSNTKHDLQTLAGVAYHEIDRWVQRLVGAGVFVMTRSRSATHYMPTREGAKLIHTLIRIATEDPRLFMSRKSALESHFLGELHKKPAGAPLSIESLLAEEEPIPF